MASQLSQPFSKTFVIRLLVALLVGVSLIAGYYHDAYRSERKKRIKAEKQLEVNLGETVLYR